MASVDSRDYFRKRAEQERAAADRAADERSAHVHRELAKEYRRRADAGERRVAAAAEAPVHGILPNDFRIVP